MGVREGLACLGPQHSTGRFQNPQSCKMCRKRCQYEDLGFIQGEINPSKCNSSEMGAAWRLEGESRNRWSFGQLGLLYSPAECEPKACAKKNFSITTAGLWEERFPKTENHGYNGVISRVGTKPMYKIVLFPQYS